MRPASGWDFYPTFRDLRLLERGLAPSAPRLRVLSLPNRRRYVRGLTPKRRSKARRKASALANPTDSAMSAMEAADAAVAPAFRRGLLWEARRCRDSSSRSFSTKSAGVAAK